MALFVIADLHLSIGTNKPMDVFPGWDNYVERLDKNWRAVVNEEDTVMIAGDISWAMKLEDSVKDFSFIHSLPGKKLISKGNHDYWWSTKTKIQNFFSENDFNSISIVHNSAYKVDEHSVAATRGWLYNSQTDEDMKIVNREVGRLKQSLSEAKKLGGKPVVFLHYPPVYDNMECKEILDILVENEIEDCYFGHIHGINAAKKALIGEYKNVKMHLISCDFVNFTPVLVR